mgnify:CR=1 FL=1
MHMYKGGKKGHQDIMGRICGKNMSGRMITTFRISTLNELMELIFLLKMIKLNK